MSGPSSIFSSDRFHSDPRRALVGALLCLGLLLGVRLAFAAGAVPSLAGRRDIVDSAAYLASLRGSEATRTLFFGSSRFRSAIDREVWARHEGVAVDAVENLSVQSGTLWDALWMLRRAGGLPTGARRVVVELSPWEFNANRRNPVTREPAGLPAHFWFWGSLGDRLAATSDAGTRARLLAQWAWPTRERRPLLAWWAAAMLRADAPPTAPTRQPAWPYHASPEQERTIATRPAFQGPRIAADHFFEPELSPFALHGLEALASKLVREGVEVAFVLLPYREGYLDAIAADPGAATVYGQAIEQARRLEARGVRVLIWERAADLGLPEDALLLDYGHYGRSGARRITAFVADALL